MGPCVPILAMTQCAIWILEFEGPENVFLVVTHVLGVSEF